jgi:hypothetical protein
MLIIGSTFELRETPKNLWSLDFTMGRCSATVAKYKVWLYPNSIYRCLPRDRGFKCCFERPIQRVIAACLSTTPSIRSRIIAGWVEPYPNSPSDISRPTLYFLYFSQRYRLFILGFRQNISKWWPSHAWSNWAHFSCFILDTHMNPGQFTVSCLSWIRQIPWAS